MDPAKIDTEIRELEVCVHNLEYETYRLNSILSEPARCAAKSKKRKVSEIDIRAQTQAELKKVAEQKNTYYRRLGELEAIYDKHRWSRCYLVVAYNGHLHSSKDCCTCNKGDLPTRFCWWTELSGLTEEELVKENGELCCSVCYPSAPVDETKNEVLLNKVCDWIKKGQVPERLVKEDTFYREVYQIAKNRMERQRKREAKLAAGLIDPVTGRFLVLPYNVCKAVKLDTLRSEYGGYSVRTNSTRKLAVVRLNAGVRYLESEGRDASWISPFCTKTTQLYLEATEMPNITHLEKNIATTLKDWAKYPPFELK